MYFSGGILYSGTLNYGGCGDGDIAEHYGTEESLSRGDIVMLGTTTSSRDYRVKVRAAGETSQTTYTITTAKVRKATAAERDKLIGAVPTSPFTFSKDKIDPNDKPQEVALVGHVPIKMTLEGGPVAIGDPITVAEHSPGKGMKAITSGRILGYALEPYARVGDSKDGMIEVFIHLEDWQTPADKAAGAVAMASLQELKAANDNDARAIQELRREFEAYKKAHP